MGLDGYPLKGRLQGLAVGADKEIRDCANLCDAYRKQRLLVKVLKGPAWVSRLTESAEVLARRRAEFEFALAMHTAANVDHANLIIQHVNGK